ncbi:UNVERIFIED_CONTAM: hypothetical protein K2H54_021918 [Gekko kuhli]
MMWVPLVFFLGVLCSVSRSQVVLTQPPSLTSALGSTVQISCSVSGQSINNERARWYQQKSGGVPWFLYQYYKSNDQGRGSGVPERFTVSPDTSNNIWNLVITGVQAEDEADYYCSTWDIKLSSYHSDSSSWGTETKTFPVSHSIHASADKSTLL